MADTLTLEPAVAAAQEMKSRLDGLPISQRMTPRQAEALYGMAYRFLEQGHFDRARECFWTAAMMRPSEARHWHGLAISLRRLQRHGEAAGILEMVHRLEPTQWRHVLEKAECLVLAGEIGEGRQALQQVVDAAASDASSQQVRQRAVAMLQLLGPAEGEAS